MAVRRRWRAASGERAQSESNAERHRQQTAPRKFALCRLAPRRRVRPLGEAVKRECGRELGHKSQDHKRRGDTHDTRWPPPEACRAGARRRDQSPRSTRARPPTPPAYSGCRPPGWAAQAIVLSVGPSWRGFPPVTLGRASLKESGHSHPTTATVLMFRYRTRAINPRSVGLATSRICWGLPQRMAVRPWKSSIDDESDASPLVFGPGKTFQKRSVSSPAPVTIVCPSGDIAR